MPWKSPVESFTATMFGRSARRSSVSCSMRVAVLEMGDQAALGWFVVVRGHHEDAVRARVFGRLREREGLGCGVRARAADQLALATDRFADGAEEIGLLLVRDRG